MGRFERKRKKFLWLPMLPVLLAGFLISGQMKKTSYLITDGNRVFTYETYATDPGLVLTEAGVMLEKGDRYEATVTEGKTALTVRRNRTVTLLREEIQHQTYSTGMPYATCYVSDDSLPVGMEKVIAEGMEGEMRCRALVTYVNGEETQRVITEQILVVNPVKRVIARGTGSGRGEESRSGVRIGENTITLPGGEVLTYTATAQVRATAYTHTDPGCDFITATGTRVRVGTVAVDPRYIPYGTRMFIVSNDGAVTYGISVAEDCGGAIKGDRVDLYYPTYGECIRFGRRDCTIYFLG